MEAQELKFGKHRITFFHQEVAHKNLKVLLSRRRELKSDFPIEQDEHFQDTLALNAILVPLLQSNRLRPYPYDDQKYREFEKHPFF